jgi:hypothetical protein
MNHSIASANRMGFLFHNLAGGRILERFGIVSLLQFRIRLHLVTVRVVIENHRVRFVGPLRHVRQDNSGFGRDRRLTAPFLFFHRLGLRRDRLRGGPSIQRAYLTSRRGWVDGRNRRADGTRHARRRKCRQCVAEDLFWTSLILSDAPIQILDCRWSPPPDPARDFDK